MSGWRKRSSLVGPFEVWAVIGEDGRIIFDFASEADADRIIRDHKLAALCLDVHEKRTTIYGFLAKLDDALAPVEKGEKR